MLSAVLCAIILLFFEQQRKSMRRIIHLTLIILFSTISMSAFASADVEIKKIASGVWVHTSYYTYPNGVKFPSSGLIVQDGEGVVLVDTAWGELATLELMEQIRTKIKLPIKTSIVTHAHGDRIAGTDALKSKGIPVYSHPLTQKFATEYGLPVPDQSLESIISPGSMVSLGKIDVIYPGPGHAMDNLMIWLPQEKILFGGCAVRAKGATSLGNTAHSDIGSWLQGMKHISQEYNSAQIVVPGHGELGDFSLISNTLMLLSESAQ